MKTIVILFAALVLAGCSTTMGNKGIQDQTTVEQIKPGATKEEVVALIGKPASVFFTNATEETWTYAFSKSQTRAATFIPVVGLFAGGGDMQFYTLTVQFDGDTVTRCAAGQQEGHFDNFAF